MYTVAIGATVIILIILAGVKPLERRFISVRQQRTIQLRKAEGSDGYCIAGWSVTATDAPGIASALTRDGWGAP